MTDGRTVTWARKRIAAGNPQPGDVEAVAAYDGQRPTGPVFDELGALWAYLDDSLHEEGLGSFTTIEELRADFALWREHGGDQPITDESEPGFSHDGEGAMYGGSRRRCERTVTDAIEIEWTVTDMTHWVGCAECDACVKQAIDLARCTGSTSFNKFVDDGTHGARVQR